MKVHIQYGPKPEHLAALGERLHPEIRLTVGDVPLVHGLPSRADITASPMLRALIVPWAGTPIETLDLMQTFPGIPVYSLHYNVGPTAEMAIALLLAAAKMIAPFDRNFRRHRWASPFQDTPGGVALEGKTALMDGAALGNRRSCVSSAYCSESLSSRRAAELMQYVSPSAPGHR